MEIIFKKVKRTCCILEMEDGEVGVICKAPYSGIIGVIIDCTYTSFDGPYRTYNTLATSYGHSYFNLENARRNEILIDIFDKGTTIEF